MKYIYILVALLSMASSLVIADDKETQILFSSKSLTPEAALTVARAALETCRKEGMQISVVVIDKGSNIQVMLRDRLAGIPTLDAALLKARSALGFRISTSGLNDALKSNADLQGLKQLPGILVLGGGVIIEASGQTVGAVGVGGANDSKIDEKCAMAGVSAIQDMLEFAD
jgi:uncharacterized protein GlcG (DUF336 family)